LSQLEVAAPARDELVTPSHATGRLRLLKTVAIPVAASAFLLWLAVRGVSLDSVGSALSDARPVLVIFACLLILASYPLLAYRWSVLVRPLGKLNVARMTELVLVGAAANNALPGRLGEVARTIGLSRSLQRPFSESLGTVLADRVADVVLFGGCFTIGAAVAPSESWVKWVALGGAAMAVGILVVIIVAIAALRRHGVGNVPESGIRRHILLMARGLTCLRGASNVVRVVFSTLLAWGAWIIGAWLAARSLDINLTTGELLFTTGAIGLGSAIPAAPGFIGTYHWLAASSLQLFDVPASDALAFAILVHALWYVPTTIVGTTLAMRLGIRWSDLKKQRQQTEAPVAAEGQA
jgi:glycosyltransferase 2 family protein